MAWLGIFLFLLFIAPVRTGVRLNWDENGLQGAVGLMVWGLREQADFSAGRDTAGTLRLTAAFRGKNCSCRNPKEMGKRCCNCWAC